MWRAGLSSEARRLSGLIYRQIGDHLGASFIGPGIEGSNRFRDLHRECAQCSDRRETFASLKAVEPCWCVEPDQVRRRSFPSSLRRCRFRSSLRGHPSICLGLKGRNGVRSVNSAPFDDRPQPLRSGLC